MSFYGRKSSRSGYVFRPTFSKYYARSRGAYGYKPSHPVTRYAGRYLASKFGKGHSQLRRRQFRSAAYNYNYSNRSGGSNGNSRRSVIIETSVNTGSDGRPAKGGGTGREFITCGQPVIRCTLLTSARSIAPLFDSGVATVAEQVLSTKGVYWKGLTERVLVETSDAKPLLHRRILFSTALRFDAAVCGAADSSTTVLPRTPLVTSTSRVSGKLAHNIFGDGVDPGDWCSARVACAGLSIIEDKLTTYNQPGDEGSIKQKKFYNELGSKVTYKAPDFDFGDVSAKPGNIYLVDIYRYGLCSLPDGKPLKMEEDDDGNVLASYGTAAVTSKLRLYYGNPTA